MDQETLIVHQRNKIMLVMLSLVFVLLSVMNLSGGLRSILSYIVIAVVVMGPPILVVFKQKLIKQTMYYITIIVFALMGLAVFGTPTLPNLIFAYFWIVFLSLYQKTSVIVLACLFSVGITVGVNYMHGSEMFSYQGAEAYEYLYYALLAVLISAVLIVTSRFGEAVRRSAEKNRLLAEESRQQMETVWGQTHSSLSAMTAFSEKLSDIVKGTGKLSHEVVSSMNEMAASSEIQTQSMADVDQAMGLVNEAIDEVSQASNSMNQASNENMDLIVRSHAEVQELTAQVDSVQQIASQTVEIVQDLSKKSTQISEIANFINEIAQQTNLVALNASIEAARAGEHGRGFTVVAEEIRKLADNSRDSVHKVLEILTEIESSSAQASVQVHSSQSAFQVIHEITSRVKNSFDHITENTEGVVSHSTNSGLLVDRLKQDLGHITTEVNSVATISDQNQAAILTILQSMELQSKMIQDLMANFTELEEQTNGLKQSIE